MHALIEVVLVGVLRIVNVGLVGDDNSRRKTQKVIDLTHPTGVELGKIVVDGHHVDAFFGQGVQINWRGGYQRLTFTSLHFSHAAFVQNNATN